MQFGSLKNKDSLLQAVKMIMGLIAPLLMSSDLLAAKEFFREDFNQPAAWSLEGSVGVVKSHLEFITSRNGKKSIRVDYEFGPSGGFLKIMRAKRLQLPEDYRLQMLLRGQGQSSVVEFKLTDDNNNVWWHRFNALSFPKKTALTTVTKDEIVYAWGPDAAKAPREIKMFDWAIVTEKAEKGTLWIEGISFEDQTYSEQPKVRASSSQSGFSADRAIDGSLATAWQSQRFSANNPGTMMQSLDIDFKMPRRIGAVMIDWIEGAAALDFVVLQSSDAQRWQQILHVTKGGGRSAYIPVSAGVSPRFLRIQMNRPERKTAESFYGIRELRFAGKEVGRSAFDFMNHVVKERPRGAYPKYLYQQQTYWTTIPVPEASGSTTQTIGVLPESPLPALLNEEGQFEMGAGVLSIEPSLRLGEDYMTWAEANKVEASLVDGYLPMPVSQWTMDKIKLSTTAFARFQDKYPVTYLTYRLENQQAIEQPLQFNVAFRPYPVNPPWQYTNSDLWMKSGFDEISYDGESILIGASGETTKYLVVPLTSKEANDFDTRERATSGLRFGAKSFLAGPLYDDLAKGKVPTPQGLSEVFQFSALKPSGVLQVQFKLPSKASREIHLAVLPLTTDQLAYRNRIVMELLQRQGVTEFQVAKEQWQRQLNLHSLRASPKADVAVNAYKTTIAHILGNRKGSAIEPGPRRYATSWIRDGAVMASALLQAGHIEPAKNFFSWFALFVRDSGYVPCCITIDREDPPYIEYDSNGQFLYLLTEIYRYTRDQSYVQTYWPKIKAAVKYLSWLRQQTMKQEYLLDPAKAPYYGLLPPSVSHEGYLGNPVHAYWDDYWAVRGLEDIVWLAEQTGATQDAKEWAPMAREFRQSLFTSIQRLIEVRKLPYIPASVEKAEFDPPAMGLIISLLEGQDELPQTPLKYSIEKYLETLRERETGQWKNSNYTAYELRLVEPLLRLGKRQEAIKALNFYLREMRAPRWNQWPEITWLNPSLASGIGDMPHSWIGAEYARAFRSFYVYEERKNSQMVIASGLPVSWLASKEGASIRRVSTEQGTLSFTLQTLEENSTGPSITLSLQLNLESHGNDRATSLASMKWMMPPGCTVESVRSTNQFQFQPGSEFVTIKGSQWEGEASVRCKE